MGLCDVLVSLNFKHYPVNLFASSPILHHLTSAKVIQQNHVLHGSEQYWRLVAAPAQLQAWASVQVLYGMDYLRSERQQQHALLRAALMEHVRSHPEALIVIEEYDKLDCATRGFFRQLLENARTANVSLDRYCLHAFAGLAMNKQELCSRVSAT